MIQKSDKYVNDIKFRGNSIGRIYKDGEVYWGGDTPAPSPVKNYMKTTIVSSEGANFDISIGTEIGSSTYSYVAYSLDGVNWTTIQNTDEAVLVSTETFPEGTVIYWKGSGYNAGSVTNGAGLQITSSTGSFDLSGDIRSLIYDDTFDEVSFDRQLGIYAFAKLFNGSPIRYAHELLLPSMSLNAQCYYNMFSGSTIETAPSLPATTLADSCYQGMFAGCRNLVSAPELPATTLATYCYAQMFSYCTNLINPPSVLPALTLANECYYGMFQYCNSLTASPEISATTAAYESCRYMFQFCTSLTKVPTILPATTLVEYCYSNMFKNCSSLTTAPELPALTLVANCYRGMFQGCTNLNYVKAMFTTTPGANYTASWTSGVSSTGTFIKNINATWTTTGISGVPTRWTIETASE